LQVEENPKGFSEPPKIFSIFLEVEENTKYFLNRKNEVFAGLKHINKLSC